MSTSESMGTADAFSIMNFFRRDGRIVGGVLLAADGIAGKQHGPASEKQPEHDASRVTLLAIAKMAPGLGGPREPGDDGDERVAESVGGPGRQVSATEVDDLGAGLLCFVDGGVGTVPGPRVANVARRMMVRTV